MGTLIYQEKQKGELTGLVVKFNQRDLDSYVNLTEMAKPFGRRVSDWSRTESAKAYLEATSTVTGIHIAELLLQTSSNPNLPQGTWAHPLIAIAFAQWLNPYFHVWCNIHIKQMIEGKLNPEVKVIQLSAKEKLECVERSLACLKMLCGENLEKLDERDKRVYIAEINNLNREILNNSEKEIDEDERALSLTEVAHSVFGVRVRAGSKTGCDAHLGRVMVKRWQEKHNLTKEQKPETSSKYVNRPYFTNHQASTGQDIKSIYVYHKEDWHLIGELLTEQGYKVKQNSEFLLAATK